jgi:hypothetical protein
MTTTSFTVGQRVISAPGLHWMPVQRRGTVILDNGHDGVVVLLDAPLNPYSKGQRKFFLYRNILPLEVTHAVG